MNQVFSRTVPYFLNQKRNHNVVGINIQASDEEEGEKMGRIPKVLGP
jgi:hypothetical protein